MIPFFTLVLPVTAAGAALAWAALRALHLYGECRAVACPETREPVAVRLDARRAVVSRIVGRPADRLAACSRWPAKRHCGQSCLSQVACAPRGRAAEETLARLRQPAACALCGSEIPRTGRRAQKPVLMSRDRRRRVEWDSVAPEELLFLLATHAPICWTCHMAESYRDLPTMPRDPGPGRPRPALATS